MYREATIVKVPFQLGIFSLWTFRDYFGRMNKENSIMKTIRSTPMFWACAALVLIGGAVSTGVNANTITMNGYNGAGDTVSCDPECFGFVGPDPAGDISLDMTIAYEADPYPQAGDPAGELARLNELLALFDPARTPVGNVNKTDVAGDRFSTSLQYFSIKQANDLFYFENTSGGSVTVALLGRTENYSHWTEYGPPSPIPVPAAFWLFGTALIGFIGISRRTKVA